MDVWGNKLGTVLLGEGPQKNGVGWHLGYPFYGRSVTPGCRTLSSASNAWSELFLPSSLGRFFALVVHTYVFKVGALYIWLVLAGAFFLCCLAPISVIQKTWIHVELSNPMEKYSVAQRSTLRKYRQCFAMYDYEFVLLVIFT